MHRIEVFLGKHTVRPCLFLFSLAPFVIGVYLAACAFLVRRLFVLQEYFTVKGQTHEQASF